MMIRVGLALASALLATSAVAQQDATKCATVTVSTAKASDLPALLADAECYGKAAASASTSQVTRLRKARELATPVAAPTPAPSPTPPPTPAAHPMTAEPLASNFDTKALLWTGRNIPGSAAPDTVGAFRFICTAGQVNRDDPILYPGIKNGSPHLHQWYGNTEADWSSTFEKLRTTGDSTCNNKLNRSAYWAPTMLSDKGMIRPDYISIYYKRLPDGDPLCRKVAAEGCFGWPTGLRVVSGYDMKRMGQAQPENKTYSIRCITPGRLSPKTRDTTAEAIADCKGEGQIMAAIAFGACWNGQLDSPDHRSHLTALRYRGESYPQCPTTHPRLVPQLTQQIAYTIEADDGEVWFSSDRMGGMVMAGGSTFHADVWEAWDGPTRETWLRECIGKLLNCADGELGDGTMMRRGPLPTKAEPRLVPISN